MWKRARTCGCVGGVGLFVAAIAAGCGSSGDSSGQSGGGTGGSARGGGGAGGSATSTGGEDMTLGTGGQCAGLECQQVKCEGDVTTDVTGQVFAPDGVTPLYNVVVYVPNAPLSPFMDGASCDTCGSTLSGKPLVTALTDTNGAFVLKNAPAGANVPLVMQVGKWRRQITMPTIAACTQTPLTDPQLTRLPRNRTEGDIPKIAMVTGGADPLECLLRKIGIDDSEFSNDEGPGRVHLFHGSGGSSKFTSAIQAGASFSQAADLWSQKESLMAYDVLLMACEGNQNPDEKGPGALQAMFDYTSSGGRVFASHWNNYWLELGPTPFPQTATFDHQEDLPNPITALVDTTFPKGQALSEWLVNVGASSTLGEIEIKEAQHTVDAANPAISQQWIYQPDYSSVQYFTFNTPIEAAPEAQCGRVVFSDIHVSSGDLVGQSFPDGCVTGQMSPQEKALLFMLFDLSSCVQPDDTPPEEPPT